MKYWYMFPASVNENNVSQLISNFFTHFYENPLNEFTLYISSTGGDIDSAIRFYDFVKSSGIILNTVGFGQVDSSAIILFLSGKKRTLIKSCRMRLHSPTYNGTQQSQVISVHMETTSFLKEINNRYFEILENEINTIKNIQNVFRDGRILKPKEALELGIATAIDDKLPIDK